MTKFQENVQILMELKKYKNLWMENLKSDNFKILRTTLFLTILSGMK
jgi:hypothetical protein